MRLLTSAALLCAIACAPGVFPASSPADWQAQHDSLVARLRALASAETRWGPAWQPIYHAALPWYERWGGNPRHDVDDWMVAPETYADNLATALEQGRNYFAENPGALIPLAFTAKLPGGRVVEANYWLTLPAGFPQAGRTYPLSIGLHGSGWLGHKISFVAKTRKDSTESRAFSVTPIDEAGPWQIDFLNAYLDELERLLPIDADRVYLGGHSLGAMATWEWALANPERFAALSPRAGRGEPYRAVRLRNVPAWVIHGERDDAVYTGFADQMVTALEDCGGRVRYSLLPGGPHNMPDNLDEGQIMEWYLRQTRSHEPVAADPRDKLGLGADGFSKWEVVTVPATSGWKSEPVSRKDRDASMHAVKELFDHVHARGESVDAPVVMRLDPKTDQTSFWLAVPRGLVPPRPDATVVSLSAGRALHFYFRGTTDAALAHLAQVRTEAQSAGYHPRDEVWITPLSLWYDAPSYIAEYRIDVD